MFYDNLLRVCEEKGKRLTNILKELHISSGNMSKWKSGGVPKSDTISRLAEYLNVSSDCLLGIEDINKTPPQLSDEDLKLFYDIKGLTPEQLQILRAMVDSYKNQGNRE